MIAISSYFPLQYIMENCPLFTCDTCFTLSYSTYILRYFPCLAVRLSLCTHRSPEFSIGVCVSGLSFYLLSTLRFASCLLELFASIDRPPVPNKRPCLLPRHLLLCFPPLLSRCMEVSIIAAVELWSCIAPIHTQLFSSVANLTYWNQSFCYSSVAQGTAVHR